MQDAVQGDHLSKSNAFMLPILDLNPNDATCIYLVLLFVIEEYHNSKKTRYRPFIRGNSYANVVLWQHWHYNGWVRH